MDFSSSFWDWISRTPSLGLGTFVKTIAHSRIKSSLMQFEVFLKSEIRPTLASFYSPSIPFHPQVSSSLLQIYSQSPRCQRTLRLYQLLLFFFFFFSFIIEFQLMTFDFDNCVFYYQTKTPNKFWYKWRLNPKSFIQPLETLPVELTKTHNFCFLGRDWWWQTLLWNYEINFTNEFFCFNIRKIHFLAINPRNL